MPSLFLDSSRSLKWNFYFLTTLALLLLQLQTGVKCEEPFDLDPLENNELPSSLSVDDVNVKSHCYEMGFNPHNLLCSSCQLLDEYELSDIRLNCSKCCNEDTFDLGDISRNLEESNKKYSRAILEVCTCKLKYLPHLTDFLGSDLRSKYPGLIQKHVEGAWPTIALINEGGTVDRTFSITKWNGETMAEFLDTYLVSI